MNLQLRAPLIDQDRITNGTILLLDIGVVDRSLEEDLGSLEGVFGGELQSDRELATLVRRILRTVENTDPLEQVLVLEFNSSPRQGLLLELLQFLREGGEKEIKNGDGRSSEEAKETGRKKRI